MEQLGPGVYLDEEKQTIHVFTPDVLRHMGLPDTRANRAAVLEGVWEALRKRFPHALISTDA